MNATPSSLRRIFLASSTLLAVLLPAVLLAQPVVLDLNNPGQIDGQNAWTYTPGTGTRASEVRGEPGGLFRIASDGGILAASPRHFFTRAGLDGNPKMNAFAARPVTLSGTTYVRFLLRMETRDGVAFGTDPYEFFFGFGDNPAAAGFPLAFAALKIQSDGSGAGMETAAPGGAAFFPDARVALNETHFVVARFSVNEGGLLTGIDLWLDPESGDGDTPDHSTVFEEPGPRVIGDPVSGVVGNASFRFRSQNGPARLDNLAIGSSWADVVPAAYTGPSPRPPVILAAPNDVVGMLGEEWTARAVLVQNAAEAAAVSVGARETVSIFLVDSPAQISGYQWMFNTGTSIPAGSGGTSAAMPFILHTGIQVGTPVRLPIGGVNSLAARVLLAAGGNLQTANARLAETPSTEIITQPVSRTVLDGDRVSLSVTVDSPFSVTYQWFGPSGLITGATDRVLTLNPARVGDSGEYYVVVTDETENTLESARATLTVVEFVIPADARVVRLFPSSSLGGTIEFDGIEDDQLGPPLSPHPLGTEPPTVASVPRGLFNALIGQAYQAGRGGVFDFNLETAEIVSGIPRPTGPNQPFLPFDYPVLREGNAVVRDGDGNLQFDTNAQPAAGLGYIGEFLLNIGERDIRVVPNVRNSGGFADGYAGRESGAPNYIHATGLLPHPNGFLVTDPFPLARINPHEPSGTNQITSSPPYMLGASSFLELTFDPEDLIDLAGFVFINRNYFQSHRATKDFANKPNIRATATFANGVSRIDLRSTGFTFQGDDGPGLGQNTFFGFQSPEEGYYLERIEVWALGNNFRLLFDIDDLAVAVEGEVGELPPVVQTEPQDKLVFPGDTVTFSVVAESESEISYQWFFGETELSGEAGSSLTLTNVSADDEGLYWVRLTNEVGASESRRAALTLRALPNFAPPSLTIPSEGSIGLEVDVNAPSGIGWTLQASAPWISVVDAGGGSGPDRIRLSFSANNNVNERTGRLDLLIVVAGEPTPLASLEVVQAGAPVFFDIFETNFSVGAAGGVVQIELIGTEGAPWSFDPGVTWAQAPSGMSGEASGDFDIIEIVVSPNPNTTARSTTFELQGTDTFITISQDPAPIEFEIEQSLFEVGPDGEEITLVLTGTPGAPWSFDLGVNWILAPDGTSGEASGMEEMIRLVVAPNFTLQGRTTAFELVGTSLSITIIQSAPAVSELFPGATEFEPEGAFLLQGTWFVNGVLYTEVPGREGSFIYSPVHGWLGLFALEAGVWLYDFELSLWYFTNEGLYPWFFAGSDVGWIFLNRGTWSPNRFFWVASLEDWVEEALLSPPAP